jgi:hypothetical protein
VPIVFWPVLPRGRHGDRLFSLLPGPTRWASPTSTKASQIFNEIVEPARVLERAIALAEQAAARRAAIVTLGRDLYYGTRRKNADDALDDAKRALLAALGAAADCPPPVPTPRAATA